MKRIGLALILIIFAVFVVHGQNQTGPIDLVLLLDTSTGMSSSYDNVNNYITGGLLTEFLRVGDTFHLIAFSQTPRLDVARRISAAGDLETIIGRMMLQYPVERGSNIQAALTYVEQYTSALPSRPKKIILVSTGTDETANIIAAANQRLSSRNTTIDYVRITPGQPITNTPSSGRAPAQRQGTTGQQVTSNQGSDQQRTAAGTLPGSSDSLRSDSQQEFTPTTSGTVASGTATPGASTSGVTTPGTVTPGTTSTTTQGTVTPSGTSATTSGSTGGLLATDGLNGTGSATGGTTTTTDGTTTSDRTSINGEGIDATDSDYWSNTTTPGSLSERRTGTGIDFSSSLPWIIGIILLLLLIIGIIILLASRRLGSSPNRVMAEVASSSTGGTRERVDHSKDLARYAAVQNRRTTPYSDRIKPDTAAPVVINPQGPLLLNLFVEDQNTHIGKRNIHSLKSGYSLSVGGGKGDGFFIFLVPIPPHIGELRRNGSQLSFIPKKAKYFPDIGSNELRDCLNKTIRIISDKNYELRFRFEMYEDPLIALNRMLNSINVPG